MAMVDVTHSGWMGEGRSRQAGQAPSPNFVATQPWVPAPNPPAPATKPQARSPRPERSAPRSSPPPHAGPHLLLQLARPLLMAVPALRAARPLADPAVLHQALAQALRDFSARARAAGLAAERVMTARYVLCALLDEVATDVLAGHPDGWVRHNLLATFHNQPGGGAKFFVLLNRMSQEPAANLDLLELMDCTLALGFEGPYRRAADGQADLRGLHHRLAQLIAVQRAAIDSAAAAEVKPAAEAPWTKRLANATREGLGKLRQSLFSQPAMPASAGVSPLPPGAPPA